MGPERLPSGDNTRHSHVCEGEELDPSRVDQISWCQTVLVLSRPFGQKTSSQSQYQQISGNEREGYQRANVLERDRRYRIETSFNTGGRNVKKEGDST